VDRPLIIEQMTMDDFGHSRIAADSWRFQLAMPSQSSYGSGPSGAAAT
jgi:hypothetical protein